MQKKLLNSITWSILFLVLPLSWDSSLYAQEKQNEKELSQAEHFKVSKAVSKIKIDGILNEKAWEEAVKIDTFYEWTPGDKTKPPVDTECLVTFSKSHFYVAFRCFDPEPQKIRAHIMDRDNIDTFIQDDHITIMIDTFNDERRAFQFRANSLGVQAEANFSELEGYEDFSWDAIWKSAGRITDFGYVVEIAIPFNQLRFPRTTGEQTWGFSAGRSYPRNVRHRMESHTRDRNSSCLLCLFNKISGLAGISPGKNLEFDPTLTLNRTDQREDFPLGEMKTGEIEAKPGISARWGVTPNLTLNVAVNPDFSQVEADVAQLEVNTRFALYYPEKRPFFLEGADFFLTPFVAVFPRTVFDPLWGVKATGKIGKNALGIFAAQDTYNNLIFPANQGSASTSLKENIYGGVLRYRRDVGRGSTLGILYTGRMGDEYYNHTAGTDGFFRLSRTKTVNFQFLHSRTDYPEDIAQDFGQDREPFGGNAFQLQFTHFGRSWIYGAYYHDITPGFRADYGFMPRVDVRRIGGALNSVFWGDRGDWFNRISLGLSANRVTDHEWNLTDQSISLSASYTGPLQTALSTSFAFLKEFYNGVTYDINRFDTFIEMKPIGGLYYNFYTRIGDSIDYANSRLAHSVLINPGIEFAIGTHLNVNLNHIFERLSLKGEKIYVANLFQTRLIYNFNVKTFMRAIVQYTDIDRNAALYNFEISPTTKGIFTQFLFSYKINPLTVLFIGYSDNYLGMPGIDITQTNRTFFLKIGYALVL